MPPVHFMRRAPFSYVFAMLICISVALVKVEFNSWIGPVTPFLLFFGAIMLASWVGGLGAGIFSVLFSATLIARYFLSPFDHLELNFETFSRVALFGLEGVLIAFFTWFARHSQEKLAKQVKRQTALTQISRLALSNDTSPELLYQNVIDGATSALELSHATLLQIERGQKEDCLVVCATKGWKNIRTGDTYPAGKETPAGFVLQQSEAIIIPDTHKEQRFTVSDGVKSEVRSSIIAPIGPVERGWGVLAVNSTRLREWQPDEIAFVCAIADTLSVVIERENAKQKVLDGEQRYRNFLEQSTEAIWRIEMDKPIDVSLPFEEGIEQAWDNAYLAECNNTFANSYGFDEAEQMKGMRLWQILKREDESNIEYLRAAWESNFRIKDAVSEELDRYGNTRWFSNNLVGIIEDGALLRLWGTQYDITDQRQANERVLASEQRFRTLFESSPVAMAIIRDGAFLYANRSMVQMLGYNKMETFVGRSANEFIPAEYHTRINKRISKVSDRESETLTYEIEGLRVNGLRFPMRVELARLNLADGKATMAFAFDLTEDKRAKQEIAGLLKKERRAAKRAIRLQEIATALSRPLTTKQIAHIAIERAIDALGASGGLIMVPDQVGRDFSVLEDQGFPAELLVFDQNDPAENTPLKTCFRDNDPLWMSDLELWDERFPIFGRTRLLSHTRALAIVPLEVEGNVAGILGLSFPQTHQFDEEQRAFIITLGNQIAGSLERARLDAASKELARRQQESLALLNTLLDSAPVGFALFDRMGRYVLLNDALAEIDGVPLEAHLGKKMSQVLPEMGTAFDELLRSVWRSGRPSGKMDINIPATDPTNPDSARYCLTSFYPVRVASGEILGVGAVVLEITDRVRTEREKAVLFDQLETERARFEAILQQMPSAVIIADAPSGRLILGNPQVGNVFGHEFRGVGEVAAYTDAYKGYRLDGSELPSEEWPLARAIQRGETVSGEEVLIERGDGSMGVIRLNSAPIRDKDNNITAGVVIFDDVTERAKSDAAQRFLAEASSSLISTIDEREAFEKLTQVCVERVADWCIVAIPGEDGQIEQVSIAYANVVNATLATRFKNQMLTDPNLPWDVRKIVQEGRAFLYTEHNADSPHLVDASESYIQLIEQLGAKSAIVAPLAARGRVIGVMIWLTAESGRKYDDKDLELADELARRAALTADNARLLYEAQAARDAAQIARDEAQSANRAKDEFLAVVSHELRTPLTPILGWLELLRQHSTNESLREQAYSVIERNANAQAQLVNDILDVSRITTGKLRLELHNHSFSHIVEAAIESLKPIAIEKNIVVETQIQDVGDVRADASRLQQVIWNLMQNAIKFTPEGGHVYVQLNSTENDMARLCIRDTGQGIPKAFLPHVFDRFRQADSSSTRKQGGLGLGLAIVTHIVELHNGTVGVESEGADQGSVFHVEIPLSQNKNRPEITLGKSVFKQDSPLTASQKQEISEQLRGIRVLLVDDEPDTREALARLLESAGATIRVAPSATRAIEIVPQFWPDIVVSDIAMPEMDGYELLEALKDSPRKVPVIALTAYAASSDIQKAMDAGFDKHLAKPVNSSDLVLTVKKLANR